MNIADSYELETKSEFVRDFFFMCIRVRNGIDRDKASFNLKEENINSLIIFLEKQIQLKEELNKELLSEVEMNKKLNIFRKYYDLTKNYFGKSLLELSKITVS